MLKLNYFRKDRRNLQISIFYEDIINLIPELDKKYY